MINSKTLEHCFTEKYLWQKIGENKGYFSVTPDSGKFRRFFSSHLITRTNGHVLLGLIGFSVSVKTESNENELSMSAYITNFKEFIDPPIMQNVIEMDVWIRRIIDAVLSLPSCADELIESFHTEKLGNFNLNIFLESTPNLEDFYSAIGYAHKDFQ